MNDIKYKNDYEDEDGDEDEDEYKEEYEEVVEKSLKNNKTIETIEKDKRITTIPITQDIRSRLKLLKYYDRESYSDLLNRMINIFETINEKLEVVRKFDRETEIELLNKMINNHISITERYIESVKAYDEMLSLIINIVDICNSEDQYYLKDRINKLLIGSKIKGLKSIKSKE